MARHRITKEEVEELFEDQVVTNRRGLQAPDRIWVFGRTASGRYLKVICQELPSGALRPFTGWEMNRHEREIYDRQTAR